MSLVGRTATHQPSPKEASPPHTGRAVGRFVRISLDDGWRARVLVTRDGEPSNVGDNGHCLHLRHWRTWLRDPLAWGRDVDRRAMLKSSSTTTVCRIQLTNGSDQPIEAVFKRGRSRHLRKRLFNVFRVSRPLRTCRRATQLIKAGIATARPLAVLERRRLGLLMDSAFITEYLPNATDLENLLTVGMRELPGGQIRLLKHQLADALADFVLSLQAAGFFHRDLKALNVIVQWSSQSPAPPRISLVDLDGLKRAWMAGPSGWMRMLMRLNVSVDAFRKVALTDRLRVLKRYLACADHACSWKSAWRQIAILSDRKRKARDRAQERSFAKYGRY